MKGLSAGFAATALAVAAFAISASAQIAIVDTTVIDGTGAPARSNVSVLIEDGRIAEIAQAGELRVPDGTRRIDGGGRFLLPGFIDSNVHASIYGNSERRETVVKYGHRNDELALEFLQRELKHGVTTVRDSYGALEPLLEVRERIARGEAVGARILVAGNIVGWGGPFSLTFSLMEPSELTLFQERWNDHIAQGAGEELLDMGPAELRGAINAYLDKGVNFVKYGGTAHFRRPSLIGFSPRTQRVLVEETHKRGLIAETHATSPESLRLAVLAGIDFIQHPEILSRAYPDELVELIIERGVICGVRSNVVTGERWRAHLKSKAAAEAALADAPPPETSGEKLRRERRLGVRYELQRRNAERLIAAGCPVSIATDSYQGRAPEFRRAPKPLHQEAGIGSILAVEGLVDLGMSEMEAIVAGTRNGAVAAGMLEEIGTVEEGKLADLILLGADPLDDIRNIRRLEMVMTSGRVVDLDALPSKTLFSTSR